MCECVQHRSIGQLHRTHPSIASGDMRQHGQFAALKRGCSFEESAIRGYPRAARSGGGREPARRERERRDTTGYEPFDREVDLARVSVGREREERERDRENRLRALELRRVGLPASVKKHASDSEHCREVRPKLRDKCGAIKMSLRMQRSARAVKH